MNRQVAQLAEAEWPAIKRILDSPSPFDPTRPPRPGWYWDSRISPGFPIDWPLDRPTLIYYVSAAGRNPTVLCDGEYFTAPWGVVLRNTKSNTYEFSRTTAPVERHGTQGVRPLMQDEVRVFQDADALDDDFAQVVAGLKPLAEIEARLRQYYRLWLSCHGAGRLIQQQHPAFAAWLKTP